MTHDDEGAGGGSGGGVAASQRAKASSTGWSLTRGGDADTRFADISLEAARRSADGQLDGAHAAS